MRAVFYQCGCLKEEEKGTKDMSGKDNPVVAIRVTNIDDDIFQWQKDLYAEKDCDIVTKNIRPINKITHVPA